MLLPFLPLLLALLPLLAAGEPLFTKDEANHCFGKTHLAPFQDGDYFKQCRGGGDEGLARIETVGCLSVTGAMLVLGQKRAKGRIVEECRLVGDSEVEYDIERTGSKPMRADRESASAKSSEPTQTQITVVLDTSKCDSWSHEGKILRKDGIAYHCKHVTKELEALGCVPFVPPIAHDTYIPFEEAATIMSVHQSCHLAANRTAVITFKHSHEGALDFKKMISAASVSEEAACYFNGNELKKGHAVRIGDITLACVKAENRIKFRFLGCFPERFHYDTKIKGDPEWQAVANCGRPGADNNNSTIVTSPVEFYEL